MLVLGLILIILSVAFGAVAIAFNATAGPSSSVTLFGQQVADLIPVQVFIAGFALALIFCIGIWLVAWTERRRRALRAEYKSVRQEAETATAQRDELAEKLVQQHETPGNTGPVTT